MEAVIYADVLFLVDVSMDFFALFLTALMLKVPFFGGRSAIASVIGAVYSVICVAFRYQSLPLTFAVSVLMCLIAYKKLSFRLRIFSFICFYAANMVLGGAMTAVFNLFNKITGGLKQLIIYGEISSVNTEAPFLLFVISLAALAVIANLLIRFCGSRPLNQPIKAEITVNGRRGALVLTEDSGNRAIEPLSGEPIIFIKESAVRTLFGESFTGALKMNKELYLSEEKKRFRVVIYSTVGGSDMCMCYRPDKITVNGSLRSGWIAIGKALKTESSDGIIPSSLVR